MRDVVSAQFWSSFRRHEVDVVGIGMIGGSRRDPELAFFLEPNVTTVGIFESDVYLDLNQRSSKVAVQFELCICSQVLEHVHDHDAFFANLAQLTMEGGLTWVAAPASNIVHGSPEYYSAGFNHDYIAKNLVSHGFEVLESGQVCSMRNYIARHLLGLWLDAKSTAFPMRAMFGPYGFDSIRSSFQALRTLLRRVVPLALLSLCPERTGARWAVESFVLARKT